MNQQQVISILIDLGLDAFIKQLKSDEFARIAAHKVASIAAAEYCKELADLAALTAASNFLQKTTQAINYTVRVTDKSFKTRASEIEYQAEAESYTSSLPILSNTPSTFLPLTKTLDEAIVIFDHHILSTFQTTMTNDEGLKKKAKQAAFYVYADTYTTVRSAYIRAFFLANKVSDIELRQKKFKDTLRSRLNKDLTYDAITPSLLMATLAYIITRVIALLLCLIGSIAILTGIMQINPIPIIPTAAIGAISITLGLGLLSGHFFAQDRIKKMEKSNQNLSELNAII